MERTTWSHRRSPLDNWMHATDLEDHVVDCLRPDPADVDGRGGVVWGVGNGRVVVIKCVLSVSLSVSLS